MPREVPITWPEDKIPLLRRAFLRALRPVRGEGGVIVRDEDTGLSISGLPTGGTRPGGGAPFAPLRLRKIVLADENWTVPSGVKWVFFHVIGGGGGGGGGQPIQTVEVEDGGGLVVGTFKVCGRGGGGGQAAGELEVMVGITSDGSRTPAGKNVSITIGQGGNGGTYDSASGGDGGTATTVDIEEDDRTTTMTAAGGAGGRSGDYAAGGAAPTGTSGVSVTGEDALVREYLIRDGEMGQLSGSAGPVPPDASGFLFTSYGTPAKGGRSSIGTISGGTSLDHGNGGDGGAGAHDASAPDLSFGVGKRGGHGAVLIYY